MPAFDPTSCGALNRSVVGVGVYLVMSERVDDGGPGKEEGGEGMHQTSTGSREIDNKVSEQESE